MDIPESEYGKISPTESGKKYAEKKFDCDEFNFITHPFYPSELSELSDHQQGFGYHKKDTNILQEEALKSEQRHFVGVIERMAGIQKIINKNKSDICDIMSTPAGARLYNWSLFVQSTWWFKLFSRLDGNFKSRIARLS